MTHLPRGEPTADGSVEGAVVGAVLEGGCLAELGALQGHAARVRVSPTADLRLVGLLLEPVHVVRVQGYVQGRHASRRLRLPQENIMMD